MFIPLEGDNIICLAEAVALYKENGATAILKINGKKEYTSFTPATLARRYEKFSAAAALDGYRDSGRRSKT